MSKKSERLYEILQDMDDDMIVASAPVNKKVQKTSPLKWLSIAACFILVTGIGVGVWRSGIADPASAVSSDDPPKVSDNITDPPESSVHTEENTDPADENTTDVNTPEAPDDTGGETPNGIGGGSSIIIDYAYYPWNIMNVDTGSTDVEGCFIHDRESERKKIIHDLYDLLKEYPGGYGRACFLYGNFMWHLAQGLNLTREDIEIYNELSGAQLTNEQIDALLIEDEIEARKALRCEDVFFSELTGELYTIHEIIDMDEKEFATLGISDEEVERVCDYLDEYIPENAEHYEGIYRKYANDIRRIAGIDPVVEDAVIQ